MNWNNLTKEERSRYMFLQTAPSYGRGGFNVPEDYGECGACNQPMLGSGLCNCCFKEWEELHDKLTNKCPESLK